MTSPPVDGLVAAAFLAAVSPLGVQLAVRMRDQVEETLAAQRQQQALQLDQAQYEARLAQRQYDAVDPENRLVAGELERRWNEKLSRVSQLAQAFAQAEAAAQWQITAEARCALDTLAQDLPGIWRAATTSNQERKQLLRCAIETVQLDGVSQPGVIAVQIQWRSGAITVEQVDRPKRGSWSLQMPAGAVALIEERAARQTYEEIAGALGAAGWRTAHGREFTSQHVGYVCRRHGWGRGTAHAGVREEAAGAGT